MSSIRVDKAGDGARCWRLLASAPMPIYVVNDDRKIVYCNTCCGDWVGAAAEELTGLKCGYHTSPQAEGLEAAFLPNSGDIANAVRGLI